MGKMCKFPSMKSAKSVQYYHEGVIDHPLLITWKRRSTSPGIISRDNESALNTRLILNDPLNAFVDNRSSGLRNEFWNRERNLQLACATANHDDHRLPNETRLDLRFERLLTINNSPPIFAWCDIHAGRRSKIIKKKKKKKRKNKKWHYK